jgi:formate hydrogenlyase subunit 3/multisubunit Na+/H+ antiporter MnhD subunit
VWRSDHALINHLGGWAPPLAVALRADGFSAVMLVASSVVLCGIALFARPAFRTPPGTPDRRVKLVFWTLLLAVSGALNAVFLGNDLFNLYVALELLTFAAVLLVCLDGRAETLAAALRYLLFALLGSVLYLPGAAAILVGSALASRRARLKLLVACSTVAQIGYLFVMFPLAIGGATAQFWSAGAWTGGILQAVLHAFAKAAMFMAAGLMAEALGHDRIAELKGIGRALQMTVIAFALGGLSLMWGPPSGAFAAKWLLLHAAVAAGQWWWAVVILIGGLLAGGYVFRVLACGSAEADERLTCAP